MAGLSAGILLADVLLAHVTHLTGVSEVLNAWPAVVALVVIYLYARWARFGRFAQLALLAMWVVLLTNGLSALIQIAGRTPAPLVDGALARIDGAVGFSAGAVVAWAALHSIPARALSLLYEAIEPFMLAAIFLPSLCGRIEDSRRYVLAVTIAAVLTAVIFGLWPASGPWTVFHYPLSQEQADVTRYLGALKSAAVVPFDFRSAGVVSFPSFHCALALLCVPALWRIGWARYPAAILAVLISLSTLTTGWHYGVDVIGGIAVTLIAYPTAALIVKSERRLPRR